MNNVKSGLALLFPFFLALLSWSCKKDFKKDDYTAYFGGEVINPIGKHVFLYRGEELVDSIKLDKNNRFFAKFDSLAPGLYNFRHDPEYQYVYFDKNDSLMVAINSRDFDESIVFSGRGDQKNNFLMEMYLRVEKDRDTMFTVFDYNIPKFTATIERAYRQNHRYYRTKKEEIGWSEEFDKYAQASVDLPHYTKKELYPLIHRMRTGENIFAQLPSKYYDHRKKVELNDERFAYFSPFVQYVSHMLSNMSAVRHRPDDPLESNIGKMKVADSLFRNKRIKNIILNSIAFNYMMEDQDPENNRRFISAYDRYSTDGEQKREIMKIGSAINRLTAGNRLPEVNLLTTSGAEISSSEIKGPAVIFFWTDKATTHLAESHKKVAALKKQYPGYNFIAINLDEDQNKWLRTLGNYTFSGTTEYRCADFEQIRFNWAITKIHRTIILNEDGTIKDAFSNIFEVDFGQQLEM